MSDPQTTLDDLDMLDGVIAAYYQRHSRGRLSARLFGRWQLQPGYASVLPDREQTSVTVAVYFSILNPIYVILKG